MAMAHGSTRPWTSAAFHQNENRQIYRVSAWAGAELQSQAPLLTDGSAS